MSCQRRCDVLVYVKVSLQRQRAISNNVIFALKISQLSEGHLMTVVINMHKTSFIFM